MIHCLDMHLNHFVAPCCNVKSLYLNKCNLSIIQSYFSTILPEILKLRSKQEHPGLGAYSDTKLQPVYILHVHVSDFMEILVIAGLNLAQIESGLMQTQQNLCQSFLFFQFSISCLDLLVVWLKNTS